MPHYLVRGQAHYIHNDKDAINVIILSPPEALFCHRRCLKYVTAELYQLAVMAFDHKMSPCRKIQESPVCLLV